MKSLVSALAIVLTAALGLAQNPAPGATLDRLSTSARQQLDKSIQDLNRLREQIEAEKLPLSKELTDAEETLKRLRGEHDRVTRLVDQANLDVPEIQEGIKRRGDELTYVGGLLDEYARNFETRINPCELQYCGEAVERAKQASSNPSLSTREKFEPQIALAELSLTRLFDALGGMRFPGIGVDLQGAVATGQFALIGPVALFRAESGSTAGLVVTQTGSDKPLIRPLEGNLQVGLVALLQTGEGFLPLDPMRGAALKALVQKTNLLHIFEKGGPIMWPLLLASMLALGTVLERLVFLLRERWKRDPAALEGFFAAVGHGDLDAAVKISMASKFYLVRALGYALSHRERSLASALFFAQSQELKRFRRGIPILDTVITLAPLLGLLGTVTGMMGSFSLIGGELSAPGAITGGIAEALIATAFGLGIAITALIPFNYLNTKMEEAGREIESAATQLELLVQPQLAKEA